MQTIALTPSSRRRRLAWAGGLFLAFDAITMGAAVAWMTGGRHLGLAAALAAAGVAVSALLAGVLARRPRARLDDGVLHVDAGFQRIAMPLAGAVVRATDLRQWPARELPATMRAPRWWQAGDANGWQRDASGQRWFAALPAAGEALAVEGADGERVVIAAEDRQALHQALLACGARPAG